MDVDDEAEIRVVCAWCGRLIREGEGGGATSHGLCEACAAGDPLEMHTTIDNEDVLSG